MTRRSLLRLRVPAAVLMSLALLLAGITSCFSERSTSTETVSVTDCTTPSNVAGATLVFIRDFLYVPVNVHVKAGASVAWVNCEPTNIPHTSTADAAGWESGSLAPNDAYVLSFPTVGTYPYHCAVHPSMKATVIVE
jgi:plastocyanin